MSYKIVWKLCERRRGKLSSAVALKEDLRVYYYIGKSARPKVGLLFAFNTRENAIRAIPMINYDSILVKCKARISKRSVPEYVASIEYSKEYWNCLFSKVPRVYNYLKREMPIGTLFCTEVIPIEVEKIK